MKTRLTTVLALLVLPALAGTELPHHDPCNLFDASETVTLPLADGWTVKDGFGRPVEFRGGRFPVGYYEATRDGARVSFGVVRFDETPLDRFLAADRRFGLKWWDRVADRDEALRMLTKLGFNWNRAIQGTVPELCAKSPSMCIVKVERFPEDCFDTARYGKLSDWTAKNGEAWMLKTVPKKGDWEKYLRESLAKIPKTQKVFEIWNEAWDKMSAEDFAEICRRAVKTIKDERPDAIVGPNLFGEGGDFGYDARVIAAGGMEGMDMVCLHPYWTCEDRIWLRDYRAWISAKCGHPIDVYITEYGTHSTPEGAMAQSEFEQAATVARQSAILYAGGCKALVPHWVGQNENDPTYHECWFGFIRRDMTPKPVLVAHAASARLIDGSAYRGELWFGPRLEALLFARDGKTVLALFTRGERRTVELDAPRGFLDTRDLFGTPHRVPAKDGKVRIEVSEAPVYVTGLPGDLKGEMEIRADRWPDERPPRPRRTVPRGRDTFTVAMTNPKVAGGDASGTASLGWDGKFLYVSVRMRDNDVFNPERGGHLWAGDSVELFVGTKPRDTGKGFAPDDYQLFLAPDSADGVPVLAMSVDREAMTTRPISGAEFRAERTAEGWTVEAAIPWSAFPGVKPEKGTELAVDLRVNDADRAHKRWKLDARDNRALVPEDPTTWAVMELK